MTSRIQAELGLPYAAAWARQDVEAIVARHTEDTVMAVHAGGTTVVEGREALRSHLTQQFAATPPLHFSEERVTETEDLVIVEGRLALSPEPGAPSVAVVDILRITEDLQIVEKTSYLDVAGFASSG